MHFKFHPIEIDVQLFSIYLDPTIPFVHGQELLNDGVQPIRILYNGSDHYWAMGEKEFSTINVTPIIIKQNQLRVKPAAPAAPPLLTGNKFALLDCSGNNDDDGELPNLVEIDVGDIKANFKSSFKSDQGTTYVRKDDMLKIKSLSRDFKKKSKSPRCI